VAKSTATSIQKLRNLLSGTDVNSTDYTACRVQVPPRPVLDSASHPMCRDENDLTAYRPAQIAIHLANQTTTKAIGAGTALIQTGSTLIKVPQALQAPRTHRTLVAVSQLAKQGTLMFTGSQFWHKNCMAPPTDAEGIAKGETMNGVYLFEEPGEASAAAAIRSRARNSFNVARRLSSLYAIFNRANASHVLKHMRSLMPKPLSFRTTLCSTKCDSCFKGKATRAPHPTRDKKGVLLQLINLDAGGPFPASRDGNKYYRSTAGRF
jgi:hypothetical protein